MKSKIKIIIPIIVLLLVAVSVGLWIFYAEDSKSTLTLSEKRWIENNKSSLIDFGITNNIAILSNNGEGILFDFLISLEENTGLVFNKISYNFEENINLDYYFGIVNEIKENDILLYSDNYVIVGKNDIRYESSEDLNNFKIGVLNENLEEVQKNLDNDKINYVVYEDREALINDLDNTNNINGAVISKLYYLNLTNLNNSLYIMYGINEINDNYVIRLGNNEELNNILTKYYKKWEKDNYDNSFSKNLTKAYFSFSNFEDSDKTSFRSKRYNYGYVNNIPFDVINKDNLYGFNMEFISAFEKISEVEVEYKRYGSYKDLLEGYNNDEIDFFFRNDYYSFTDDEIKQIFLPYSELFVILQTSSSKVAINSMSSLQKTKSMVIENSIVSKYLTSKEINVENYSDVPSLSSNLDDNSVVVLDIYTYNYYKDKYFAEYNIEYQFVIDGAYSFIVKNNIKNSVFVDYFNFYIRFVNAKDIINDGYESLNSINDSPNFARIFVCTVSGLFILLIVIAIISKIGKKNTKKITKEDKLRYVDMLTSLKNRNYLNDNIEKWDESEIYPQTIIIVDLNNVAYINDNYGHQEGDNVIREAANILITSQLEKSEIIRTNGNEFLIYLIEYDEKQVISYIKRLSKEFKDLSHGFGAAIGYSVISDAIKTLDDAINEATLDMRNNKEEAAEKN